MPPRDRPADLTDYGVHTRAYTRAVAPEVEELRRRLIGTSNIELITAIAGLQLHPANTPFSARLESAMNLALTLPIAADGRSPQLGWLNGPVFGSSGLGRLDDAFENLFTDSIAFVGGPYTVLPGREANTGYVLQQLLLAAFGPGSGLTRSLRDELGMLTVATLRLSDAMAERAGLRRGLGDDSRDRREVHIPKTAELARLRASVSFTPDELRELLAMIPVDTLRPLIATLPRRWSARAIFEHQRDSRPIVVIGGRYVVTHPQSLTTALRHALLRRVVNAGRSNHIARTYHRAVAHDVAASLRRMNWIPLGASRPHVEGSVIATRQYWTFDRARRALVIVCTDALAAYGAQTVQAWPSPEWPRRLRELTRFPTRLGDPRRGLTLTVVQHAGRWTKVPVGPAEHHGRHWLGIDADDLNVISCLEAGDPLALLKFASATVGAERYIEIVTLISLGAYGAYHRSSHGLEAMGMSMASEREGQRSGLLVQPGVGSELRAEVAQRMDPHPAVWIDGDSLVHVWRVYSEPVVPIYTLEQKVRPARLAYLHDALIWVVGAVGAVTDRYALEETLCDVVAYWLWRMREPLSGWVAELRAPLTIFLELRDPEQWLAQEPPAVTPEISIVVGEDGAHIQLGVGVSTLLVGATNAGERVLMHEVVRAIREATGAAYADHELMQLITRTIPDGHRRIPHWETTNTWTNARELLPLRAAHGYDRWRLEVALAPQLSPFGGRTLLGPDAVAFLHRVVALAYERLRACAAALAPRGTLETVIAQHERVTWERHMGYASAEQELHLWTSEEDVLARMRDPGLSYESLAVAQRFLIEYLAARPPAGRMPIDLVAYDELLALASAISGFGVIADEMHYGLRDARIRVSPRGQFVYADAHEPPRPLQHLANELIRERLDEILGRADWSFRSGIDEDLSVELDAAFASDIGVSFTEINNLLVTVYDVGDGLPGPAKVAPRERVLREVNDRLAWGEERVARAFDLLALAPRADFMLPKSPFKPRDVYPWRFNRPLSFVRRPFVLRRRSGRAEYVWGQRHLASSAIYLYELCVTGRLARTPGGALDQLLARLRGRTARRFNDQVAALIRNAGYVVGVRLSGFDGTRLGLPERDLGDIDVLAVDTAKRRIYLIETKDVVTGRSPYEIAQHLRTVFGDGAADPASVVAQQLRRVAWVRNHLTQVLSTIGVLAGTGPWRVDWLVVFDQATAATHRDTHAISLRRLTERLTANQHLR